MAASHIRDEGQCLRVSFTLPRVQRAAELELTITPSLVLLTGCGYDEQLHLPRPVKEEAGSAKFDKKRRVLTLSLPVDEAALADTPSERQDGKEIGGGDQRKEVEAEASVKASEASEEAVNHVAAAKEEDEASESSSREARRKEIARKVELARREMAEREAEQKKSKEESQASAEGCAADAISAPFEWRQNKQYVALILQVPSIIAESVERQVERRELRIRFRSTSADKEEAHHQLTLRLAGEVLPHASRHDVADQNMMVVLQKATPAMWPSLEPENDDLEKKEDVEALQSQLGATKLEASVEETQLDEKTALQAATPDESKAPMASLLFELD